MSDYLELKVTDCKHCYKCIRNCPVKAIRFADHQATIVPEECVLCGRCYVSCPQKAKKIHLDLAAAQALVAGDEPVYASIAPAFVANYPGLTIETLDAALKKLGFAGAEEAAQGARLVKDAYDDLVRTNEREVIVSTCCHTVNMLVERYYPEVLPAMAPVISPMQAHAKSLKERHPGAKVVFIGPCISKKAEVEAYPGCVDVALTFMELDLWLAEAAVALPQAETTSAPAEKGKSRLFPIPGGILRTMARDNPDYEYLAIDGMDNCIAALKDIAAGNLGRCFVEMSACNGSCIGGPAMSHDFGVIRSTSRVNAYARCRDFDVPPLPAGMMAKKLEFAVIPKPRFGTKAIEEVLGKLGKTKPENELNCGSCGYETCREKAAAVLEGKANLEMCLPYLMEKTKSFSDAIIKNTPNGIMVLDEDLQIQQINGVARKIFNVKHEADVIKRNVSCLLDPDLFIQALTTGEGLRDSRQYLTEYGRYVQFTIVQDVEYGLLIAILRDVTESERTRIVRREVSEKTIQVTDEVIAHQMRTVQEIASLLGETAAETKIALTKLKETLRDD